MTSCLTIENLSMLLNKGFDTSCPVSKFLLKSSIADADNVDLELSVNGELRQKSNTRELIANCSQIISYLSKYFTLEYGDLILTGTPSGISYVKNGDVIEAKMGNDLASLRFNVIEE